MTNPYRERPDFTYVVTETERRRGMDRPSPPGVNAFMDVLKVVAGLAFFVFAVLFFIVAVFH